MPEALVRVLEALALTVDVVGVSILALAAAKFATRYAIFEFRRLRGFACARWFRDLRLELGSHIVLAIDFMVISDVIHTTLAQTLDSLMALAAVVVIRSALAFFVGLDMNDVRREPA